MSLNECPEGCRVVCDEHRKLLADLEWNRDGRCNGCNGFQHTTGHEDDCWVLATLGPLAAP